ncbi:MAG: peptide ABC transporter substrate-binding protein [Saprospiraceae bacterium]|nr:peptide ABC transporter substrate-binding protein [Pyrinomonadaceae bacterium]
MKRARNRQIRVGLAILALSSFLVSCATQANSRFYGKTEAPKANVLHYISGSEPESLDPAVPTGQPEARVLMALYDGLVEYHPKTMEPMPGIAQSWEKGSGGTEYIFHLRKDAKFSNGDPVTAKDFVYSFRRAVSPELASKNAYLEYYVKYAEGYNSGNSFVKGPDGKFLLKRDFDGSGDVISAAEDSFGPETEFHKFIGEPERLTVPGAAKGRTALFEKDPKLKAAAEGKEFVPVRAEDVGVEAIDDHTFRIKLIQPAPYFIGLLGHQFFRVVHQPTIEKHGKSWTKPANIVTSGAFLLKEHRPYDQITVVKDPGYWDAAMVKLDSIEFYPMEEATTMMNLYKAGSVDAMYNHTAPAAWNDVLRGYKDEYLNFPEVAVEYYTVNVKKAPMNNPLVRKAFALAIDREALAKFRKTTKPLVDFSPEGIFPQYEIARTKIYTEELKKQGSSLEEWKARIFNPEKARKLLVEAGYPMQQNGDKFSFPSFPIADVELTYNTAESNKASAEFMQAQWRQNLGITVPLKNMEWKTFLNVRKQLEYNGLARAGWVGDYMDPFTFLNLFYSEKNDSSTGWSSPKFDKLLDDANKEPDEMKRFEILARAELFMMQEQPILPLQTQATNWIKKPYVKGMYPNPGTLHPWKFIYIERDPEKWDRDVENIMINRDEWVEGQIGRLMASQTEFIEAKKALDNAPASTAKAE